MKATHALLSATVMAVSFLWGSASAPGGIRPADLRCEYLVNPLGIDEEKPRLSWRTESKTRGQKQTAYRLLVASSAGKLTQGVGDLWDTGKGTQTSYVLPLAFGMVDDDKREAVAANLVKEIMINHKGHLSVGTVGVMWLMQTLTDIGYPDVAYAIAAQRTKPSWGYMAGKGATTVWDRPRR